MESIVRSRAVLIGHLTITAPVVIGIVLLVYGEYLSWGPAFSIYFLMAGIGLGWQWCVFSLPMWKTWVIEKGIPAEEADGLARRTGLAWLAGAPIGPFALHTAAAGICGFHLGPWLLSRWYGWIRPLAGMSARIPTGNDNLRNFELVSIVPALVLGYLLSKRFGAISSKLSSWAWGVPTLILGYKLLTWTGTQTSVLTGHSQNRFEYFFMIQRSMPLLQYDSGNFETIIRVATQLSVVGPFYAGLAYSLGALVGKQDLVKKLFEHPPLQQEPESDLPETEEQTSLGDESEEPVHRSD